MIHEHYGPDNVKECSICKKIQEALNEKDEIINRLRKRIRVLTKDNK